MSGHCLDCIAEDQIPGSSASNISHERAREQAGSHGEMQEWHHPRGQPRQSVHKSTDSLLTLLPDCTTNSVCVCIVRCRSSFVLCRSARRRRILILLPPLQSLPDPKIFFFSQEFARLLVLTIHLASLKLESGSSGYRNAIRRTSTKGSIVSHL